MLIFNAGKPFTPTVHCSCNTHGMTVKTRRWIGTLFPLLLFVSTSSIKFNPRNIKPTAQTYSKLISEINKPQTGLGSAVIPQSSCFVYFIFLFWDL